MDFLNESKKYHYLVFSENNCPIVYKSLRDIEIETLVSHSTISRSFQKKNQYGIIKHPTSGQIYIVHRLDWTHTSPTDLAS